MQKKKIGRTTYGLYTSQVARDKPLNCVLALNKQMDFVKLNETVQIWEFNFWNKAGTVFVLPKWKIRFC